MSNLFEAWQLASDRLLEHDVESREAVDDLEGRKYIEEIIRYPGTENVQSPSENTARALHQVHSR